MTGTSNAGKKKGRAKRLGKMKIPDLNRGRMLGDGKANIMWPGLNSQVARGSELNQIKVVAPSAEREKRIQQIREGPDPRRRVRAADAPLVRGWVGSRMGGQSMGLPDPVADHTFEGFDTRCLEFKMVTNMTGTLGRRIQYTAFVVAGNKNGIAGYGQGKSQMARGAIRVAKNRSVQNLMYVPLFEGHTVFHNMYIKYHGTKLFIHKKEKGYGLKCHRVLKTICEQIGIKDLHVKVEGSTKNVKAITKAFFEALNNQENLQQLADRTGYHIVERRMERDNLPVVVASPSNRAVQTEEYQNEDEDIELSYTRMYHGGRKEYNKGILPRFYAKYKSYRKRYARLHKVRNQQELNVHKLAGIVDKMEVFCPIRNKKNFSESADAK